MTGACARELGVRRVQQLVAARCLALLLDHLFSSAGRIGLTGCDANHWTGGDDMDNFSNSGGWHVARFFFL
jgi:hypothetical protein